MEEGDLHEVGGNSKEKDEPPTRGRSGSPDLAGLGLHVWGCHIETKEAWRHKCQRGGQ